MLLQLSFYFFTLSIFWVRERERDLYKLQSNLDIRTIDIRISLVIGILFVTDQKSSFHTNPVDMRITLDIRIYLLLTEDILISSLDCISVSDYTFTILSILNNSRENWSVINMHIKCWSDIFLQRIWKETKHQKWLKSKEWVEE